MKALVLGGGGVAGIAWELGVLLGLTDSGVDIVAADRVIGTSAGSAVAAQVTSGVPLAELFERQASGAAAATELTIEFDPEAMMAELLPRLATATPGQSMRAAIGRYALEARTVSEAERFRAIQARLPVAQWPDRELRIVAVDAESGEDIVFTRESGVDLATAVAASCAVPGVWPAVTIDDRRYVDGGVRSSTNLDLAAGCQVVVELAPVADLAPLPPELVAAVAQLRATARVVTIAPDDASLTAIGGNPLDPSTASPAALAGRALGRAVASEVREAWHGD